MDPDTAMTGTSQGTRQSMSNASTVDPQDEIDDQLKATSNPHENEELGKDLLYPSERERD